MPIRMKRFDLHTQVARIVGLALGDIALHARDWLLTSLTISPNSLGRCGGNAVDGLHCCTLAVSVFGSSNWPLLPLASYLIMGVSYVGWQKSPIGCMESLEEYKDINAQR